MNVFDAVYVNTGGGKVLLQLLVDALAETDVLFCLDERLKLERMPRRYIRIASSEIARLRFYREIRSQARYVFCFGNVPPPLRLACTVCVYFHGPVILDCNLLELSLISRFKFKLKRLYISILQGNASRFVVQTSLMADALSKGIGFPREKIDLKPFWNEGRYSDLAGQSKSIQSFGYVSLPYPHKNHAQLLDAWELLAERDLYPELHLTVPLDDPGEVLMRIDALVANGLKVINHGFCDPKDIYGVCFWQIFPSLRESFGLGLIEAVEAGCAIVAPDLAYVHAVVEPSLIWAPTDGASAMANAVEAVLTKPSSPSRLMVENKLDELIHFFIK